MKRKIVVFGGGGGIKPIIEGLKYLYDVTAIVAASDDGKSTGILKNHSGVAVGDFRNALISMAEQGPETSILGYRFKETDIGVYYATPRTIISAALDEGRYGKIERENVISSFEERFKELGLGIDQEMKIPVTTKGHPVGNLILTWLIRQNKDWVDYANKLARSQGFVLPNTLHPCNLYAIYDSATHLIGESYFDNPNLRIPPIQKIGLWPNDNSIKAYEKALQAVREADIIIIPPGSFYASTIASVLPEGFKHELSEKIIIWFANFFYDLNQTLYRIPSNDGEKIITIPPERQIEIIEEHFGKKPDLIIAQNPESLPKEPDLMKRYNKELGTEDPIPDYKSCGQVYLSDLAFIDYIESQGRQIYVLRHNPRKVEETFRYVLSEYNL
ncbi:MAG: 2-phospho-L-lactate transferase CofD family protein [Candidatus Aenigmatarchaeota archaeon]|nr:YvcK family protein [Candidatus Aenigmarchaeota archaeon]